MTALARLTVELYANAILVTLVIMGAISSVVPYVSGSALVGLR